MCKVCSEKQSILRAHASSPQAKDLRPLVQKLNLARGKIMEERSVSSSPPLHSPGAMEEPLPSQWSQFASLADATQTSFERDCSDPRFITSEALPTKPSRRGRFLREPTTATSSRARTKRCRQSDADSAEQEDDVVVQRAASSEHGALASSLREGQPREGNNSHFVPSQSPVEDVGVGTRRSQQPTTPVKSESVWVQFADLGPSGSD